LKLVKNKGEYIEEFEGFLYAVQSTELALFNKEVAKKLH
jgi:hypothetical protein